MTTNKESKIAANAEPKKIFNNIIRNINDIFSDKQIYNSNEFQKLLNRIML